MKMELRIVGKDNEDRELTRQRTRVIDHESVERTLVGTYEICGNVWKRKTRRIGRATTSTTIPGQILGGGKVALRPNDARSERKNDTKRHENFKEQQE